MTIMVVTAGLEDDVNYLRDRRASLISCKTAEIPNEALHLTKQLYKVSQLTSRSARVNARQQDMLHMAALTLSERWDAYARSIAPKIG